MASSNVVSIAIGKAWLQCSMPKIFIFSLLINSSDSVSSIKLTWFALGIKMLTGSVNKPN
jgi:hypothetical protein